MSTNAEYKSRERLKDLIEKKVIKEAGSGILDLADVAIGNKESFNRLRGKSLRLLNNAVRDIVKELETHYNVNYDSKMDSVLEINKGRGAK